MSHAATLYARIVFLLCFISVGCISPPASKENHLVADAEVKIFAEDINRFWIAFDKAKQQAKEKQIQIFNSEYYQPGSPGLKDFYVSRIGTTQALVEAVNAVPDYYSGIRSFTKRATDYLSSIHEDFRNLKRLYPEAKAVNVYLLIGRLSTAGTIVDNNLLIGLDLFGNSLGIKESKVPKHIRKYKNSPQKLREIVLHEMIHVQQQNGDLKTLLEISINEGGADFLTELIAGKHPYVDLYEYGYKNEKDLWKRFKEKMNTTDISEFLYNVSSSPTPDLGYFVGYRIVQAYYNNSADKRKAVREILTSKDLKGLLVQSGYDPK